MYSKHISEYETVSMILNVLRQYRIVVKLLIILNKYVSHYER